MSYEFAGNISHNVTLGNKKKRPSAIFCMFVLNALNRHSQGLLRKISRFNMRIPQRNRAIFGTKNGKKTANNPTDFLASAERRTTTRFFLDEFRPGTPRSPIARRMPYELDQ
jgi:hypothetical protein